MSEQRPVTITAAEFIAGDYAALVELGKCVVYGDSMHHYRLLKASAFKKIVIANFSAGDRDDEDVHIRGDYTLYVKWLPQPEREEAAHKCNRCDGQGQVVAGWDNDAYENIEGVCPDCGGSGNAAAHAEMTAGWQEAEIARLTAEVARLNKIISRLTERAGVIAWAVETVKQWEHFLNTTEPEEAPTMALCDTLNVLISKVKDYERQAAALADSEPDHR